jgi:hypothetical protein
MIATAKAARAFLRRQARPQEFRRRFPGGRQRLHRLLDLALDLRLPADLPGVLGKGLQRFRQALLPILDAFDKVERELRLEVHPTEIAFDIASAQRALEAVGATSASASTTIPRTSAIRASTT